MGKKLDKMSDILSDFNPNRFMIDDVLDLIKARKDSLDGEKVSKDKKEKKKKDKDKKSKKKKK